MILSISAFAFSKVDGLFSISDNAHSIVPTDVSVPAASKTCNTKAVNGEMHLRKEEESGKR